MSGALLELNQAKSALKSGCVIEVSKKGFEGAMKRGLENAELMEAVEIDVPDGADGGGKLKKVVVFFDPRHGGARVAFESKMAKMECLPMACVTISTFIVTPIRRATTKRMI